MKKIFTVLAVLAFPLLVSAQKEFRQFSFGIGTGAANVYGDLRSPQTKNIYIGNAEYYITPYIVGSGEVMVGNMSARGLQTDRYFQSDFGAVSGNVRLYIGHYIDRYRGPMHRKTTLSRILEGVYTGVGGGFIKSTQSEINRKEDDPLYRGWDTDRDAIIPLSFGIDNSSFDSRLVTGIRYQFIFCFGDNIDGYAIRGSGLDKFSTLSISAKYRLGKKRVYYK